MQFKGWGTLHGQSLAKGLQASIRNLGPLVAGGEASAKGKAEKTQGWAEPMEPGASGWGSGA